MKIVVSALGETADSPVDERFGRARYFVCYDMESGTYEVYGNHGADVNMQGAGRQAARLVEQLGADVVLTGHCGPQAFDALQKARIPVHQKAAGTVRDAVAAFLDGALPAFKRPDVKTGFGRNQCQKTRKT